MALHKSILLVAFGVLLIYPNHLCVLHFDVEVVLPTMLSNLRGDIFSVTPIDPSSSLFANLFRKMVI